MLRKIRIALAVLFWLGITLLFLDFTGALHGWLGWMAKVQFLPAVLALNVAVIVGLILLTLVFGRVYCSVICPLGVFQDGVAHLNVARKRKNKNRKPYSYSPEVKWLRYGVWVIFVIAIIAGVQELVALLAPYSAWGRIVQNLFQPVYIWVNNIFATLAERANSYAFYSKEVWLRSLPTFIVAAITFVVVAVLAWRNGRTWCNTVCPVGTTLSFFSRFAMFRPMIDANVCKGCKQCEHNCKAACIDVENRKIDYSRCVDCFNCIDTCKFGGLKYRFAWGKKTAPAAPRNDKDATSQTDAGRRAFIAGAALAVGGATLRAQEKKVDGGLAVLVDKQLPERQVALKPFGAKSLKNFSSRCTGCQLCVSKCPQQVLRPSNKLATMMQPEMAFDKGYCPPDCTRCSEVCPTGAIKKIDAAEKSAISIGHAVTVPQNCLLAKGVECNACSRHCPAAAISVVSDASTGHSRVAVNESRCIGCGACEYYCPVRPFSAIYVEGREVHTTV